MFLNADRWDRNHRMAIAANVKLKWISSPTPSRSFPLRIDALLPINTYIQQ